MNGEPYYEIVFADMPVLTPEENETEVQTALSALIKDKTVLIIAHRMRTVDGTEKIVVLQGGKITEQGTPKDLKAKGGIYAGMCKLQGQSA